MKLPRRHFLHLAAGAAAMLSHAASRFGTQTIRRDLCASLPASLPARHPTSSLASSAKSCQNGLGQQFVVENRPGALVAISALKLSRRRHRMVTRFFLWSPRMRSTRHFTPT